MLCQPDVFSLKIKDVFKRQEGLNSNNMLNLFYLELFLIQVVLINIVTNN